MKIDQKIGMSHNDIFFFTYNRHFDRDNIKRDLGVFVTLLKFTVAKTIVVDVSFRHSVSLARYN